MLVKSRTFWFGSVLALAATVAFTSLGLWQWGRAEWKARYLAAYAAALAAKPVPFAEALAGLDLVRGEDLPVRVSGTGVYDPVRSVLLDNQRRGAEVGVLLFTLFHPSDGAPPLLVNRGWLPLDAERRLAQPIETPTDPVPASGLLRRPPSSGIRLGPAPSLAANAGMPQLTWLDPAELAAAWQMTLPPVVLELDPRSPAGFRRDTDPLPNTLPPEQHRGYAVQWWALATAVVTIWLVLVVRALRRDGQSTPPR
jgi:cytochrome oxidase assembly protein ShyY1